MTASRFALSLLSLIFCALTGCSTVMHSSKLPEGFALTDITKTDSKAPFAVSSKGSYATLSDGKVKLIERQGPGRDLSAGPASALSFSPSGSKLAVATPADDRTILRMLDGAGQILAETTVDTKVTTIAWRSEKELVAAGLTLKRFSFGSSMISTLYLWDGAKAPVAAKMTDATIRPAVSKLPDQTLYDTLQLSVSPYGDEIAYSSLKDPPLFNPYLRIATRHLETGGEHEIGQTSVGSGGPLYTPDGESLVVGDTQSLTRLLRIPDGKEMNAWPSSGQHPALSPSGAYLFLDGRLYHEGREIASFPQESRAAFLPDGSGLVLSWEDKLYLLSGIKDKPAPPLPKDLDRLLQLRRLRSTGLITEKEYRAQKNKVPAQQRKGNAP